MARRACGHLQRKQITSQIMADCSGLRSAMQYGGHWQGNDNILSTRYVRHRQDQRNIDAEQTATYGLDSNGRNFL